MAKIGIIYGSTMGNTEEAAQEIFNSFGGDAESPISIADVTAEDLAAYDHLILGTSTWGDGELQDDWDNGLTKLEGVDLSGKKVALFGMGDQSGYAYTFVDGIGILAAKVRNQGGEIVGSVDPDGYDFQASTAIEDGVFVGLPLDNDNESSLTSKRISAWVESLKIAMS
ncbi:flavodoxin [Desulfurispirillum indicum]|uniref:flavodoxin n=1 Tax=Desulfurispirillum indicum TaxID=936456 RepID=UPI001CFB0162|nr:flavodoxin [Desulfurispirillum indicum]UCZ57317.1 flavodoxin [Desulfurispirillum indicum]